MNEYLLGKPATKDNLKGFPGFSGFVSRRTHRKFLFAGGPNLAIRAEREDRFQETEIREISESLNQGSD